MFREDASSQILRRYLVISLAVHVIVALLALLLSELSFKPKPSRVVWVQLPAGVGYDVERIRKAEGLPRSTIQEQQEALKKKLQADDDDKIAQKPEAPAAPDVKPEPKPIETKADDAPPKVEPKQDTPKKETPPDDTIKLSKDETTPPKKPFETTDSPETKKPPSKPTEKTGTGKKVPSAIDQKIADILNKTKQQEAKKIPVESAQVEDGGKGAGMRGGSTDAAGDPLYAKYYALVKERINRAWITLPKLVDPSENLKTEVVVTIAKDGTVTSIDIETSSGNYAFDLSTKNAIERASPLPIPPVELQEEVLGEGFLIEFSPTQVSTGATP